MNYNINIPLFVMESELSTFSKRNPDYNEFKRVYYKDGELAGYLAYKN